MHEIIGSALSFSSMLQLIGNGIKSLIYSLFIILKSILLFCFDSIFPPVLVSINEMNLMNRVLKNLYQLQDKLVICKNDNRFIIL